MVIRQGWGMTETSPLAALAPPPPEVTGDDHWTLRASAGRVLCGVETRIVDDEGGVLPNDGKAVGEIEIRGPWITGSYYQDDDPSKFDDGWLRTGDVGRIDPQGFITLTDRAKDVIKSGGEWISSVELELCIMDHPVRSGGRRRRGARRALAGAAAGRRRDQEGRVGQRGGTAKAPVRQGRAVLAARAVDVHRRSAEDQRRQVRQEAHPFAVRRRSLRRRRVPGLTLRRQPSTPSGFRPPQHGPRPG